MSGPKDKRPSGLSDEEAALWERAMAEARPLPKDARTTRPRARPSARPRSPASEPAPAPVGEAAPGLDRRTAARIKRGRDPIAARLDLHGLTQTEAERTLIRFIAAAAGAGKRHVLVITGKGLGPRGESGVLRRMVPLWLGRAPLAAMVVGIAPAHTRDGGEGALYVTLKRPRGGSV